MEPTLLEIYEMLERVQATQLVHNVCIGFILGCVITLYFKTIFRH